MALSFSGNGCGSATTLKQAYDRQRLNLPLNRTVQLDFDVADFRERQASVQAESSLRVGERVVAILRTKTRKARHLPALDTKEKGLESFINAAQGILQHLTTNRSHVRSNFFDAPKLIRLRYVADALTVRCPSISTFFQRSVVQADVQRCL